ncbi:MAG TPA: AI-2E family transporter [Gammaproteobacteria bacterium]|nr:AI-2E family transporter [Gammaproteobacteria bacterium]
MDERPDTKAPPKELIRSGGKPSGPATLISLRGGVLWIGILVTLAVLYYASIVLIPIAMALLLAVAFSGAIEWLEKHGIPPAGGGGIIVILLVGISFASVYGLAKPLQEWVSRAPQGMQRVEKHLHWLEKPLHEVQELQQKAKGLIGGESGGGSEQQAGQPALQFNLTSKLLHWTTTFIYGLSVTIALLYFLLATGRDLLRGVVHALPRVGEKERAVELAFGLQGLISRYLFTITVINFALGTLVALVLWGLGMPDPVLWGAMVAVFNYIPYLGAVASATVISVVAVISLTSFAKALVAIAVLVTLTTAEGQYVTPHVLGRRMEINPVMIFIALIVGAWMWGVVGAFISVPVLACITLVCEEIEPLQPIAGFLRS